MKQLVSEERAFCCLRIAQICDLALLNDRSTKDYPMLPDDAIRSCDVSDEL